jgi:hypothetical protein
MLIPYLYTSVSLYQKNHNGSAWYYECSHTHTTVAGGTNSARRCICYQYPVINVTFIKKCLLRLASHNLDFVFFQSWMLLLDCVYVKPLVHFKKCMNFLIFYSLSNWMCRECKKLHSKTEYFHLNSHVLSMLTFRTLTYKFQNLRLFTTTCRDK